MKKSIFICLPALLLACYSCRKEMPDPLSISQVVTPVSSYGGSDGSIDITVTGGTPAYSYSWSNGQLTEDVDHLTAGIYFLKVTDQMGVCLMDTFVVTQPLPDELVLIITGQDVSEFGASDGEAHANVTGGVMPYQFWWSNGLSAKDIAGLSAGIYSLTVTDAVQSRVCDSILISQPAADAIIVRYDMTSPTETGASDGAIDLAVTGGYPPFSYSWSDGPLTEDRSGLGAGSYSVTVSDTRGQEAIRTIVLSDKVTDYDGNSYAYFRIDTQTWMKENLKVMHTPEGDTLTSYAYQYDPGNVAFYGRLYTWDAAMNYSKVPEAQGVCPSGWHIPSDAEFMTLEISLGMSPEDAELVNTWRGEGIGTALKEGGSSGYEARLCGRRSSSGLFSLLDQFEYMWTSSEYGSCAWRRCLDVNSDLVGRWNTFPKSYAFSVRCIKDD